MEKQYETTGRTPEILKEDLALKRFVGAGLSQAKVEGDVALPGGLREETRVLSAEALAVVENSYVKVKFLGVAENEYTIKMTSECIETIPYEEIEEVDETKDPGFWEQTQEPHTGYVYWSYKNYYDLSGNYLRTEKCAISEYEKYDSIITVGPEPEEEEVDWEDILNDLFGDDEERTPTKMPWE